MRRIASILGISVAIAAVALVLMHAIPIKAPYDPETACCDQYILEETYGFPLAFKQVYSGGFSGSGDITVKSINEVYDGLILFGASATVLWVISATRNRSSR